MYCVRVLRLHFFHFVYYTCMYYVYEYCIDVLGEYMHVNIYAHCVGFMYMCCVHICACAYVSVLVNTKHSTHISLMVPMCSCIFRNITVPICS